MRIISGDFRGTKLYLSNDKITRPLKDLVRESIFNLITHSKNMFLEISVSNVLDLYSGTGSFGLECLSRKAKKVYFVENEKNAFQTLEKNIKKLKIKEKTKIFFHDVISLIKKQKIQIKSDIIFCDPPFKQTNIEKLIEAIFDHNLLKKDGLIILHRNKVSKDKFPNYFNVIDERTYGLSKIIFGKILY